MHRPTLLTLVVRVGIITLFAIPWDTAHATSRSSIELGPDLRLSFEPVDWLYYEPHSFSPSGVGIFEANRLPELHGFVRSEIVAEEKTPLDVRLHRLCDQLKSFPLAENPQADEKPSEAAITPLRIGPANRMIRACRVTKHDAKDVAEQWVILSDSQSKPTGHPSTLIHVAYYLYFYFPERDQASAEKMVGGLLSGLYAESSK